MCTMTVEIVSDLAALSDFLVQKVILVGQTVPAKGAYKTK